MYNTLDLLQDPNPDKAKSMTNRVRGEVCTGSKPAPAKKLKNRIRIWQVRPELLEANPHWISTGLVATNGVLWGDESDPVDVEEEKAKEKVKSAKRVRISIQGKRKRKREVEGAESSARARAESILDGRDEEAIFNLDV